MYDDSSTDPPEDGRLFVSSLRALCSETIGAASCCFFIPPPSGTVLDVRKERNGSDVCSERNARLFLYSTNIGELV